MRGSESVEERGRREDELVTGSESVGALQSGL